VRPGARVDERGIGPVWQAVQVLDELALRVRLEEGRLQVQLPGVAPILVSSSGRVKSP
jgi:hypothetical protein